MTSGEQTIFWKGIVAGTIIGLAMGLMIALLIAMKPTFGTVVVFATGLAVPAFLALFAISGNRGTSNV